MNPKDPQLLCSISKKTFRANSSESMASFISRGIPMFNQTCGKMGIKIAIQLSYFKEAAVLTDAGLYDKKQRTVVYLKTFIQDMHCRLGDSITPFVRA
jgi:peroxiredoxin